MTFGYTWDKIKFTLPPFLPISSQCELIISVCRSPTTYQKNADRGRATTMKEIIVPDFLALDAHKEGKSKILRISDNITDRVSCPWFIPHMTDHFLVWGWWWCQLVGFWTACCRADSNTTSWVIWATNGQQIFCHIFVNICYIFVNFCFIFVNFCYIFVTFWKFREQHSITVPKFALFELVMIVWWKKYWRISASKVSPSIMCK